MKAHYSQRSGPTAGPAISAIAADGVEQPAGNAFAQQQMEVAPAEECGAMLLDEAFGAGGLGAEPPPGLCEGDEVGPERRFRAGSEGHRLFREVRGGCVVVMVASTVQSAAEHLAEMQQVALRLPTKDDRRERALKLIEDARALLGDGGQQDGSLVDIFAKLFALVDDISDIERDRLEGPVENDPPYEPPVREGEESSGDDDGSVVRVETGRPDAPEGVSFEARNAYDKAKLGVNETRQYDERRKLATSPESRDFVDLRAARPAGADANSAKGLHEQLLRQYSPATITQLRLHTVEEDHLPLFLEEPGWVEMRHLECNEPTLHKRLRAGLPSEQAQAMAAALGPHLADVLRGDPKLTGGTLERLATALYGDLGELAKAIAAKGVPVVLDALLGVPGPKEVPGAAFATTGETVLYEKPWQEGTKVDLPAGILVHSLGEPQDGARHVVVASFPERGRKGYIAEGDLAPEVGSMPLVDMDRKEVRGLGGGNVGRAAGKPFPHTPQARDVQQGGLGDCFLLAGLMSAAQTDPKRIEALIPDNTNADSWTVDFGDVQKTVRNAFLYEEDSKKGPLFAYTLGGQKLDDANVPLWPAIVEKAYAGVRREKPEEDSQEAPYEADSFAHLFGGQPDEPMRDVLGLEAEKVKTKALDEGTLVQRLRGALGAKGSATAGTGGGGKKPGAATLKRSAGRVYRGQFEMSDDQQVEEKSLGISDSDGSPLKLGDDGKGALTTVAKADAETYGGSISYESGTVEASIDGMTRPAPVTLNAEATLEGLVLDEPRVQSRHEYAVVGATDKTVTLIDPHDPGNPFDLTPAQVVGLFQWIGVGSPKV